jgi:hypothetical protein
MFASKGGELVLRLDCLFSGAIGQARALGADLVAAFGSGDFPLDFLALGVGHVDLRRGG